MLLLVGSIPRSSRNSFVIVVFSVRVILTGREIVMEAVVRSEVRVYVVLASVVSLRPLD